jgi:hypothetical protein
VDKHKEDLLEIIIQLKDVLILVAVLQEIIAQALEEQVHKEQFSQLGIENLVLVVEE